MKIVEGIYIAVLFSLLLKYIWSKCLALLGPTFVQRKVSLFVVDKIHYFTPLSWMVI